MAVQDPATRSPKRAEQVAEAIEQSIVAMGWPIGALVGSEQQLMDQYGVSRGVLREAVRILEHHGSGRMRRGPGGGLIVTAPNIHAVSRSAALFLRFAQADAASLAAARKILELNCLRLVAARINEPAVASRLRRCLAAEAEFIAQAPDVGSRSSVLNNFHLELADLADNPAVSLFAEILIELQVEFADAGRQKLGEAYVRPVDKEESHVGHEAVFEALMSGDVELAVRRMSQHLDVLTKFALS